jgi:hypothetical protein
MSIEGLLVILIAIAVGVSGQLAYLFIVDHEMVRVSKGKIKEFQQQLKALKPGDENFKPLYSQLMSENSKIMKQTMKPTFVTFVPFIIIFLIMSSFFSYIPMSVGSVIQTTISGPVNGTLIFSNGCITINNSSDITLASKNLPLQMAATVNSGVCTMFLVQNGSKSNMSLSGLIGSTQTKTYNVNGVSLSFNPNPLIIANLPFSIPLIGNQINWFWAYLIFSLISSLTLNRVLLHYKLIA